MKKLKLMTIVGTRPEIIKMSAIIKKADIYFDQIIVHTGQNYDYNLNGIFFKDLRLGEPEVYLNVAGDDLGTTMGNIIASSYKLMAELKPDAVLVLGDTNSCLSVIGAKRLHIPIFHMEAGNRCKDECLPEETNRRIVDIISDVNLAYSEHARRYLEECGVSKERTFVTGSPMAEVLNNNLSSIVSSNVHERLSKEIGKKIEPGKYILLSAHREENIDEEKNFLSLFRGINAMAEKYGMPILYSCHPRSRKRLEQMELEGKFQLHQEVTAHAPLGFHDYNCLQMNAFCVVSDSGTLPEESSFFLSINPFYCVPLRGIRNIRIMTVKMILACIVALLALVNPVQKVLIVTSLQERFSPKELRYISIKSSITAALILIFFLFLGEVTFSYVFHVELYSFQITCGAVLMYNGLSGLLKGFFLKVDEHIKLADLTTVPIAIPMIAGPATITAAVTFPVQYGREITIIAILIALVVNLFCMLQARRIGNFLIKYNFMNPLIRIIGLIVATIGLQMIFDGITLFIKTLTV